jgi:hypothetical protein
MPEISFEDWANIYKPIRNHLDPHASFSGAMFETYGDEWEFVKATPADRVWSYVSEDGDWIVPGRRFVNRIGYFIAAAPYKTEDVWVDIRTETDLDYTADDWYNGPYDDEGSWDQQIANATEDHTIIIRGDN